MVFLMKASDIETSISAPKFLVSKWLRKRCQSSLINRLLDCFVENDPNIDR